MAANVSRIHVERSDGVTYANNMYPPSHQPLGNGGDTFIQHWYNKLGELIREQFYTGSDKTFSLAQFPANYHLRVYQRNGANGPRHDLYLYGYPLPPTTGNSRSPTLKYFRSPKDFFPHLLWLCSDPTLEKKNCDCLFCKPFPVNSGSPAVSTEVRARTSAPSPASGLSTVRSESVASTPQLTTQARPTPMSQYPTPGRSLSTPQPATQATASFLTPAPNATSGMPINMTGASGYVTAGQNLRGAPAYPMSDVPSYMGNTNGMQGGMTSMSNHAMLNHTSILTPPMPNVQNSTTAAQPLRSDESIFYRGGEVVWYRKNPTSFGLGLVLKDEQSQPNGLTTVQPLSNPMRLMDTVDLTFEQMRPFLTFSVPPIMRTLDHVMPYDLTQIPWAEYEAQIPRTEANHAGERLSLEASKIAAIQVDHSYSLFNARRDLHMANAIFFRGVFFGCEKINLGEAVRVEANHAQTADREHIFVMIVKNIVYFPSPQDRSAGELIFEGSVYHLVETNRDPWYTNEEMEKFPAAMRGEIIFRDLVMAKNDPDVHHIWQEIEPGVQKKRSQVYGRFYETKRLGPLVDQQWENNMTHGFVAPIRSALNNCCDSVCPRDFGRRATRLATLAGAVPLGTPVYWPGVEEWIE
ncbi:hypothetical protein M426DRAFT_9548 [Hypoxylon sp. CI-4A]|nr:hypothetical protein M426DRAFT_9548 [Hypoxylon sp. CI-4A]